MLCLQVAREFGLDEYVGMMAIQCATSLAPSEKDKAEINEISLYRKFNRMKDGNLQLQDNAPLLAGPLHFLDSTPVRLENVLHYNDPNHSLFDKPHVIFASSHS